jgi:hypothetical protein
VWNLYELFHTRYTLHKRAYQHKTANAIEEMLCEVLVKANGHLKLQGTDGKLFTPFESIHDMVAYSKLSDAVFDRIAASYCDEMEPARKLLKQVKKRQLSKFIAESVVKLDRPGAHSQRQSFGAEIAVQDVQKELYEILETWSKNSADAERQSKLVERGEVETAETIREVAAAFIERKTNAGESAWEWDLRVHRVKINYGKGDQDPVRSAIFYDSIPSGGGDGIPTGHSFCAEQVSHVGIPKTFEERYFRLYCKVSRPDPLKKAVVRAAFDWWASLDNSAVEVPTPHPSTSPSLSHSRASGGTAAGRGAAADGTPRKNKRQRGPSTTGR